MEILSVTLVSFSAFIDTMLICSLEKQYFVQSHFHLQALFFCLWSWTLYIVLSPVLLTIESVLLDALLGVVLAVVAVSGPEEYRVSGSGRRMKSRSLWSVSYATPHSFSCKLYSRLLFTFQAVKASNKIPRILYPIWRPRYLWRKRGLWKKEW